MRRFVRFRNILPLAAAALLCAVASSIKCDKAPRTAGSEIRRITVYPSGVSGDSTSVDLRSGMIECCRRSGGSPMFQPNADLDPITVRRSDACRLFAQIDDRDAADLKSLVSISGLRDLDPARERPASDDCALTLVIVWDDTTQVFTAPVAGAVGTDASAASRRANRGMAEICRRMCSLGDAYARHPYVSGTTAPQYGRFGNGTGQGW